MPNMIAYCGLDCGSCDAYIATRNNDQEKLQGTLEKWKVEYNAPEMTLDAVTCEGCMSTNNVLCAYCSECEIRACAASMQVSTCAECKDYGCENLTKFFELAPQAKVNLEKLRQN